MPTSACDADDARAAGRFLIGSTASSSASRAARDDRDVGAGLRKARRDREADALAAAGDDGGTAGKTDFHVNPFSRMG